MHEWYLRGLECVIDNIKESDENFFKKKVITKLRKYNKKKCDIFLVIKTVDIKNTLSLIQKYIM